MTLSKHFWAALVTWKMLSSWCCQVDKYGTVQPHTLIRQWMDYQHWYDRTKLSLKDIHNIIFFSCMNPTAGSFTIDPRLQRHFMVFALRSVRTGNRFKESQLKLNRFYLKVFALNNVSFFSPLFLNIISGLLVKEGEPKNYFNAINEKYISYFLNGHLWTTIQLLTLNTIFNNFIY